MNWELPDVQAGFRKGRETRDQIANICWTIDKAREFQKNIYLCFIDYTKDFDYVDHNKLWKILKRWEYPSPWPASWETCVQVKKQHGTTDWFQIGKGGCQGYILSPCFFNFYIESIIQNAGPDEVQTGINIAGRHINNLRYADDTTPL